MIVVCFLAGHSRGVPCPRCGIDPTNPYLWWRRLWLRVLLLAVVVVGIGLGTLAAPPYMVWWPWWLSPLAILVGLTLAWLALMARHKALWWRWRLRRGR